MATPETEVNSGMYTPQSLILRRRLAEAMLGKGMETTPIQSPWQGVARMAQAILGGMQVRDLEEREGSRTKQIGEFHSGRGGTGDTTTITLPPSPFTPPTTPPPAPSLPDPLADAAGSAERLLGGRVTLDSPPLPTTTATANTADPLLDFLRRTEGFRETPYSDHRQTSIGYGTRARPGETRITREEAERRLVDAVGEARRLVRARFPNLTPGQENALTDLTFNVGPGWMNEGLGAAVQSGNWQAAQAAFRLYVNASGQPLQALRDRRNALAGDLIPGTRPPLTSNVPGVTLENAPPGLGEGTPPPTTAAAPPSPPTVTPPTTQPPTTRLNPDQITREAYRRMGPQREAQVRRYLQSGDQALIALGNAELNRWEQSVNAEQPPAGPQGRADLAHREAQTERERLAAQKDRNEMPLSRAENVGNLTQLVENGRNLVDLPSFSEGLHIARVAGSATFQFPWGGGPVEATGPWRAGVRMLTSSDPRWRAYDDITTLQSRLNLIAGSAFVKGQGQVTENERKMIADAIGALGLAGNPADFIFRLNSVQNMIEEINRTGRLDLTRNFTASPSVQEIEGIISGTRNAQGRFDLNQDGLRALAERYRVTPEQMTEYIGGLRFDTSQNPPRTSTHEVPIGPDGPEGTRRRLVEALRSPGNAFPGARPPSERQPTGSPLLDWASRLFGGNGETPPPTTEQPPRPDTSGARARNPIPARPTGVPPGSDYNPARRQWRGPDGTIYDAQGRRVNG